MADVRIKKNLISSLVYQVVLIVLSFLIPRLYLENFGSEINGVLSTIKQIFTYLILLEAGVGLATTQALYKRVGEGDLRSASEVLSATNIYYKKTGAIYLVIILLLATVYSFFIPNPVPSGQLFALIILNALPSLFSYFVQAKYRILMEVDGRRYVINNSETALQIASNLGKILVLLLSSSLVLIQAVYCVINLVQLLYLYIFAKKNYKWVDLGVKPDFDAIKEKNSVLVHQLSGMVFNNTDVLLISALMDFGAVSVYAIYNIFFSQVQTFITSVTSSFTFALGQAFHVDRERFLKMYSAYETFFVMITYIVYTLMAVFLLPLIQIYTGGIDDVNYTNPTLLFLFILSSLLQNAKLPSHAVIEFSGDFEKTRSHAIWEMAINLSLTVVGILAFGICGALLGTVAALIYRAVVSLNFSNRRLLGRSNFASLKIIFSNALVFAFVMALFFVDSFEGLSFFSLLLKGILHTLWIVPLFIIVNLAFNKKAFSALLELLREKKSK